MKLTDLHEDKTSLFAQTVVKEAFRKAGWNVTDTTSRADLTVWSIYVWAEPIKAVKLPTMNDEDEWENQNLQTFQFKFGDSKFGDGFVYWKNTKDTKWNSTLINPINPEMRRLVDEISNYIKQFDPK